jgi:SSS family solute:Na+ symporter
MQGIIMILGMAVLLILTFIALGGVNTAFSDLTNLSSNPDIAGQISSAVSKGFNGWTSMPSLGSEYWLVLVTTIIMGVGIGVLAQPQLVVRFMTASDDKTLNRAIPIGGFFILITTGVAYTVGPLTNVWFFQHGGNTALTAAGKNPDAIMPLFINNAMPEMFTIVFMLVLLAAAMSTLSAIFHTLGTTAGFDFFGHIRRWREGKKEVDAPSLLANRSGTVVMIVASVALAFAMPGDIIARATAMFMGLCAAAFLPSFVHGLFSKKPSALAAKWSLAIGGITWFLWTAFVHIKESSVLGISKLLFNQASILPMPWQVVDPLIIALPASIIALGAGLLYERMRTEEGAVIKGKIGMQE